MLRDFRGIDELFVLAVWTVPLAGFVGALRKWPFDAFPQMAFVPILRGSLGLGLGIAWTYFLAFIGGPSLLTFTLPFVVCFAMGAAVGMTISTRSLLTVSAAGLLCIGVAYGSVEWVASREQPLEQLVVVGVKLLPGDDGLQVESTFITAAEVASLRSLGVPGRLVDCTRTPVAAYRAGRLVLVHRRPDAGEHILPLPDGENVIALQDEQDGTWGTFDQNHSATVRSLILKPAPWDPETTTMGMIERLGGFGSGGGGCSWNAEELMIGDN